MIRKLLMEKVHHVIEEYTSRSQSDYESDKVRRKKASCEERHAEIVKVDATGKVLRITQESNETQTILYDVHYKYLIKQGPCSIWKRKWRIEGRSSTMIKCMKMEKSRFNVRRAWKKR